MDLAAVPTAARRDPAEGAREGRPVWPRPSTAALLSAAIVAVGSLVSPDTLDAGPVLCPMRLATGIPCPGCGLTRSCAACFHGELARSVEFHPFGPLVCAAAAAALVLYAIESTTGTRPLTGAIQAVGRRPSLRVLVFFAAGAWLTFAVCRAVATVAAS